MVSANIGNDAALDAALLDITTWEVPKESFVGQVVSARIKLSDDKYNAATEHRPALPRPIRQLELNIKRFDARYLLKDGTFADVIVYGGCDLEKFDRKTQTIVPPKKTRSKEMAIIGAWTQLVGPLAPNPERLVGLNVKCDRYREYEIAPGRNGQPPFTAKNVTLPVEVLPPTYVYAGEVQTIEVKREDSIDAAAVATSAELNSTTASMASVEDAAQAIGEFLRGKHLSFATVNALNEPDFPASARREPFISAFASGTIFDTLKSHGVVMTADAEGYLS